MHGNPIFMQQAIDLATRNVLTAQGGPFAALIVRNGAVIATGANCVTTTNDPTAHAEVTAIRNACRALNTFQLRGCHIYSSCEPCPMCLAAIYWSRCDAIFFGNTAADAAAIGFDDAFLYREITQPLTARTIPTTQLLAPQAAASFTAWRNSTTKVDY